MRRERRDTTVGDGEDVGVEDAAPREERPHLQLRLDVYNAWNVGGVWMGIDEDDWEKVLERQGHVQDQLLK